MSSHQSLRRFSFPILLLASFAAAVFLSAAPAISQTAPVTDPSAPTVTSAPTLSLTKGVQKTVLDNGLTVLTKQVDTAPVVSVQVWYRIGSRNEATGVNGIAHQLEHMMFKGTKERPLQFGQFFSALGSSSNAFTSYDMTAYFGTVESDKLESLLVLEADRMRNSIIDKAELDSEKRVVISELQGYENSPSYRLNRAVMRSALPSSPYGLTVGGTKADVEKFTVDQVRYYYDTYYRPDNAVLVVVGNFQPEELTKLVKQTFGSISKSPTPLPTTAAPKAFSPPKASKGKEPIVLREPGTAALLNTVYPLPDILHPDVPALQLMDYILVDGRSSRLYQSLVETGLASEADGYAANLIGGGWYDFSITATPGQDLKAIDRALQQVIAELRDKGVTAEELTRAKAQFRASTLLDNRDITSQASQLGDDLISTGDYRFTERLLVAVEKVTAADIQRVARTYLDPAMRTVGMFEPTTTTDSTGGAVSTSQTSEKFSPGAPVDPADVAKYLPLVKASKVSAVTQSLPETLTLKNGMKILLLRDRSTPTVTLSGFITAGTVNDQAETAGLANLTAENLMSGTKTQSALEIAKTLENRGASLTFGASREGVSVSGDALSADLPTLVKVLADALQNATFPEKEVELSRQQALTTLKLELDDPGRVARRAFQQTIYPANHPFHVLPTLESLQKIRRDDLVRFYQQHYRPEQTTLALVGDFDPATVRSLFAQQLGGWQNTTTASNLSFPTVSLPTGTIRLTPSLPGKTQSITFMGYNAINRKDPRFYAAQVLNQVLGGDTLASRLGTEIRDRQGLTYGIYSGFQAGVNPGPFLVYMQTAPEDTDRAISSTISLLQQVRQQGLTPAEVAAAKRSLISSYSVELASPNDLIDEVLMNTVYGLGLDEVRDYTAKIQAVTPEQVNEAIQELLHPDNLVIVTAGPPSPTSKK